MDASSGAADQITPEWCAHHFDHMSPQLGRALHDTMAHQRAHNPVARSDQHGGFWTVSKYEDVLRVAQDWATFSSAHGITVPSGPTSVPAIPEMVDPPLHRALRVLRVAEVERATTEQDAGPVEQVDLAERPLLQPDPAQVALGQPGEGQERLVLVVRSGILGPGGQQQERFHPVTLDQQLPVQVGYRIANWATLRPAGGWSARWPGRSRRARANSDDRLCLRCSRVPSTSPPQAVRPAAGPIPQEDDP